MIQDASQPEIGIDQFHIFADGLDHPECCAFDATGTLWAGGEKGQIYHLDERGQVEQVTCLGGFTGGLAFSPDDRLFVCNPAFGVLQFDRSGNYEIFANEVAGKRMITPNFGVFDASGNLYVTDSGDWKAGNGRLLRLDAQGCGTELLRDVGYANGLALTEDQLTLFMVISDSNAVLRMELLDGGRRVSTPVIYSDHVGHVPDGLALDAESNLYVTCYASHEIYRISKYRKLNLFARDPNGMLLGGPTNLCFGGPKFDRLYVANLCRRTITVARINHPGMRLVNLRDR